MTDNEEKFDNLGRPLKVGSIVSVNGTIGIVFKVTPEKFRFHGLPRFVKERGPKYSKIPGSIYKLQGHIAWHFESTVLTDVTPVVRDIAKDYIVVEYIVAGSDCTSLAEYRHHTLEAVREIYDI